MVLHEVELVVLVVGFVVVLTYTGEVTGTEVRLTELKLIERFVALMLRAVFTEA